MPLNPRTNVQFRQFEVVGEDSVDVLVGAPRPSKSVAHLLMPPLMGSSAIAVGDRDQRCLRCRKDCADCTPARPQNVLGPHGGAMVLGTPRIPHRLHVDGERLGEASAEILGGEVDQVGRRFRIGGDCSQPFLDYLSVGAAILIMSNGCSMSAVRRSLEGSEASPGSDLRASSRTGRTAPTVTSGESNGRCSSMATHILRADARPPVSTRARVLLGRADALLSGSIGADNASDQFLDCYMAALRGSAAVLEASPVSTVRARSRSAWVLLIKAAPELESWAQFFSGHSAARAAILAGVSRSIEPDAADEFYRQVGRFLQVVEDYIGADRRLDRVSAQPRAMSA